MCVGSILGRRSIAFCLASSADSLAVMPVKRDVPQQRQNYNDWDDLKYERLQAATGIIAIKIRDALREQHARRLTQRHESTAPMTPPQAYLPI
jgi:hypothetical protein